MSKCSKCSSEMKATLTKKGVLIDVCTACQGVWLDQSEINFIVKNKKEIRDYEHNGLQNPRDTQYSCPHCKTSLKKGSLPGFSFQVEECPDCKGLYLDKNEYKKLSSGKSFLKAQFETFTSSAPARTGASKKIRPYRVKLPSLGVTSGMVGISLYALLFGVLVFLTEAGQIPLTVAIGGMLLFILLQFLISPFILDWQLKWFGSLNWVPIEKLPAHFKDCLEKLCRAHRIPLPRVGIIEDGSPQAYTYGRTPYSARVVFSRGMFDILDPDEVEAVLAHELGHIKHWDFVFMTIMQIVPIILYKIYSIAKRMNSNRGGGRRNKSHPAIFGAMVVSYIAYIISEYLVLFVSRVREYYADKFSCFATKKPNKLLTALVKIGYGLLDIKSSEKKESYQDNRKSVSSFSIMGLSSKQLALTRNAGTGFNPKEVEETMKWDLWNPWAFYYELHSTHPLTAKRINAIGSYATTLNQTPYVNFKKTRPESYWDEFFIDLIVVFLPYISGLFSLIGSYYYVYQAHSEILKESTGVILITALVFGFCLGQMIKTWIAYPRREKFFKCRVSSLLKVVKVSPVRAYPIVLKGHMMGRGDAGSIFSEDFFFKDKTGMIFLDHQPFGLNIWFAIRHFEKFKDKEVTVKGWYRRSQVPYVEVRSIRAKTGDVTNAYTFHYKMALSGIFLLITGCVLWFLFTDMSVLAALTEQQ